MDIETYRMYCLSKKGVTESTPFPKGQSTLVFKVMGKMFTATDMDTFSGFSVKCDPNAIDELRATYPAVQLPSYLNKRHWSNIVMDGSVPDDLLLKWLDISYDLVVKNLPKKDRDRLAQ